MDFLILRTAKIESEVAVVVGASRRIHLAEDAGSTTGNTPSARRFAEYNPSSTRQTSSLPSAAQTTLGKI